jgi:hypothetical protein
MADAALTEIGRPALGREHRDGGCGTRRRCVAGRRDDLVRAGAAVQGCAGCGGRGNERVEHRLLAGRRLAQVCDPRGRGLERGDEGCAA